MNTTDFTGTYDYEMAEALHEAGYLIELVQEGELTLADLPAKVERTRAHWRTALPTAESFADFDAHFTAAINTYMRTAK